MKGGGNMPRKYDNEFKSMILDLITKQNHSTLKTSKDFNLPIKTLEKWITAYNKDNHCFDSNYISPQAQIDKLKKEIKQKDQTIDILKKTISYISTNDQ